MFFATSFAHVVALELTCAAPRQPCELPAVHQQQRRQSGNNPKVGCIQSQGDAELAGGVVTCHQLHRVLCRAISHDAVAQPAAVAACAAQDACQAAAAEAAELIIGATPLHGCAAPQGLPTLETGLPTALGHADLVGTAADEGVVDHES